MLHHVVIVEGEPVIQAKLQTYFGQEGYHVSIIASRAGLRKVASRYPIDLILLDISLPGENGLVLTRALRERLTVEIVLVTGRSDQIDRTVSLEIGAGGCVTKSLELCGLMIRVKNLLWHIDLAHQVQPEIRDNCYQFAGCCLNVLRHALELDNEMIKLTRVGYEMLATFVTNPGETLSRECLLCVLLAQWIDNPNLRTIDVLIRRLRHKLQADLLVIQYGKGYLLMAGAC